MNDVGGGDLLQVGEGTNSVWYFARASRRCAAGALVAANQHDPADLGGDHARDAERHHAVAPTTAAGPLEADALRREA